MANLKYWLWLANIHGLTERSKQQLLEHFASPEDIWYADATELSRVQGVSREQLALLDNKSTDGAERILDACRKLDVRVMTMQDADYPARLRNVYAPPMLLYIRGRLGEIDEEMAVSVVGTRACSPYGILCADKISYGLAKQGAIVVSGAARGIDAAAHNAALRAGKPTVAVLGGGVDVIYPRENEALYADIAAMGALVSEYPPGAETKRWHFPARNRIISALSLCTLVVEADERSGALITAHTALEQGREVFAVPGPIDAPKSRGCNRLIAEGAGLCTDSWDILREYQPRFPHKLRREKVEVPPMAGFQEREEKTAQKKTQRAAKAEKSAPKRPVLKLCAKSSLSDDQIAVLRALMKTETALGDDLIEATGIPTRRVLSALTVLELDGVVAQDEGKRFRLLVECEE